MVKMCGSGVAFMFCKFAGKEPYHCDATDNMYNACQYSDPTGEETKKFERIKAAGLKLVKRDGFYVYEKDE